MVAEAVVAYRRRHRLTQRQLAQLLGWRQSHVSRLELGRVDPQLPTIEQLADRLGLVVELRIVDPMPDAMDRKLRTRTVRSAGPAGPAVDEGGGGRE